MRNNYFRILTSIPVLFWFACGMVYSQSSKLKTEVLVYILPDSLELPKHEKSILSLDRALIKSPSLASNLKKTKILGIEKAFPKWSDKDSSVFNDQGEKIKLPSFHRIFSLKFSSEARADSAIELLKQSGSIMFAEKNVEPTSDNDPSYVDGTQWYLNNDGRNGGVVGADINAEEAWAIYTGNSSNKIGIIDVGIEITHEEFTGRATGETPFSDPHGTTVAGVAAASANNSHGIRGVDWNARIISKRYSDEFGQWYGDAIVAQKIVDVVNEGANVLNSSYSFTSYSSTMEMAYAHGYKMNRVSVATMGNTGIIQTRYPGAFLNTIAVGATQNNDIISPFSTQGDHIDVVAPGGVHPVAFLDAQDIYTTMRWNSYGYTSGTSLAAPQVTGLASLMKGYKSNLSNDDIRQIIRLSADDYIIPGFDNTYGYGRLNAGRAMQFLQSPYSVNQWSVTGGTVYSTTSQYQMQVLDAPGLGTGIYLVKRSEIRKNVTFPKTFHTFIGAWGRGVGTKGWRSRNPNFGEGFCEIVPGTLTSTSATLRTYIYEVWNTQGQYFGFYPRIAANVIFEYSVLGISPYITGDYVVCSSGKTYTLNDAPVGVPIIWTYSSDKLQLVSSSGNTITLRSISNGEGWVKARVGTYLTANYVVWSGIFNSGVSGTAGVCPNSLYTYNAIVPGGHKPSYSYAWTYPSNWYNNGQYNNSINLQLPYSPQYGTVRVAITNECGTSSYSGITVYPGYNCGSYFTVYPNPTSELLNVEISSESPLNKANNSENSVSKEGYTVRIFNNMGNLVKTLNVTGLTFEIPVADLENGTYIIELLDGKNAYRKQFFVNR